MLILKLIQSLVKALHSEGTPGQVAAGFALGAALGLTPLLNLHNAIIFACIVLFTVSFPAAMFAWLLMVPVGFLLDPVFEWIGTSLLLDAPALTPFWTSLYNLPVLPLTNFNNTVVLGSVVVWIVLALPMFFAVRVGVAKYRATIYARVEQTRLVKAVKGSKVYNVYRWFQP